MLSHPNYVGYDALEGNPRRVTPAPKAALPVATEPLRLSDFNKQLHPGWLKKLEAVRKWCAHNAADFHVSPHDFQLAKVRADHSSIVLWAGRHKPSKRPCIKVTFEGPTHHHSRSQAAIAAILELVSP